MIMVMASRYEVKEACYCYILEHMDEIVY